MPDPNNPISILVLYDNGTLGEIELQKTNANATYETNYIKIASKNSTKVNAIYYAVDFTNYKTLHIKAKGFGSGTQWSCGYSQNAPVEGITESVERQNIGNSENIITFDISSLKGIYYPFVTGYKNSSGEEQASYLYEMWLEP